MATFEKTKVKNDHSSRSNHNTQTLQVDFLIRDWNVFKKINKKVGLVNIETTLHFSRHHKTTAIMKGEDG